MQRPGLRAGLADRAQQRGSLQHEGDRQHEIPDEEVVGRGRCPQLVHPMGDRHRAPGGEQPKRGEQRPHVRFAPVPERVRLVRWAGRPPVGHHEEELVAGVGPGMRRLGGQRGRSGDHRGDRLGDGHEKVGPERDQHGHRAVGAAPPGRPSRSDAGQPGAGVDRPRFGSARSVPLVWSHLAPPSPGSVAVDVADGRNPGLLDRVECRCCVAGHRPDGLRAGSAQVNALRIDNGRLVGVAATGVDHLSVPGLSVRGGRSCHAERRLECDLPRPGQLCDRSEQWIQDLVQAREAHGRLELRLGGAQHVHPGRAAVVGRDLQQRGLPDSRVTGASAPRRHGRSGRRIGGPARCRALGRRAQPATRRRLCPRRNLTHSAAPVAGVDGVI